MVELLITATFTTWLLIFLLFGLFLICEATESVVWAVCIGLAIFVWLYFVDQFNVVTWTWQNPLQAIGYVASYWALGLLWSFYRWDRHLAWVRYNYNNLGLDRPLLKSHKERIMTWIILWPFSVFTYICGNVIMDFLHWTVNQFNKVYEAITTRHFGPPKEPGK